MTNTEQPRVIFIAALDEGRGIGKGGEIPWKIPEDLKRYMRLTTGHPLIVGRTTFEAIGKPLPNRTSIVVTRQEGYTVPEGHFVAHTIEEALQQAQELGDPTIYINGGGDIYRLALPYATDLQLTYVAGKHDADAFFPEFDPGDFKEVWSEDHPDHDPAFKFVDLQRIGPAKEIPKR